MISRKILFRQTAKINRKPVKFMSNDSFFGKMKGKLGFKSETEEKEKDIFAEVPQEEIRKTEEEYFSRKDDEEKESKIEKHRFKSRLFYSDRALLLNQKPQAGIGNVQVFSN